MATSILTGLGGLGADIGTGQAMAADQRRKEFETALQALQAKISQQYANTNQQRFELEKQQANQPKYKGFTTVGNRGVAIVQTPDGKLTFQNFDVGPGTDTVLMSAADRLINSIKDPVKQQRARDAFLAHAIAGDTKGGFSALQAEVGREESENAAEARQQRTEEASDRRQKATQKAEDLRQQRSETFQQEQQQRAFTEREKLAKTRADTTKVNQGLNVLHAALFGLGDTPGLSSTLNVLDDKGSRAKLIGAKVGATPNPNEWTITRLAHAGIYQTMSPQEKAYAYQLNRAVSAIQALRTVTGLPRSTQALMQQYAMELPDPVTTPSAKDGQQKLALVEREIKAALSPDALAKAADAEAPAGKTDDLLPGETLE